ncbi:tyrosine-protein phosphatase [Paenibacillus sp. FSL H7-0326]|uniref:tyrosine-protein phosphatase n=1 Tax=Paenibacillus sp. FSL H7-0326 TaxID=1921144 RepID=UPI0009FB108B|nr:tyrosine-protein phosphatase [Paenibacillus sp. FSL H7-0326]
MKKIVLFGSVLSLAYASSFMAPVHSAAGSKAPIVSSVKQGIITGASVERTQEGKLIIRWNSDRDLGAAKVYWSTSPDGGWKELARTYIHYHGYVTTDPNPGSRVYFKIKGGSGSTITVAERKLPLKGTINFRDLGGYRTADGHTVKWGKLYRSDELAALTESDIAYLIKTGLKTDLDYRTSNEVKQKPDPVIEGVTYVLNSVFEDSGDSDNSGQPVDFKALLAGEPGELAIKVNRDMVAAPDAFKQLFELILDPANAAVLQHCTAGKDRTGLGSALVLLALGVPEETVIEDYLLSNKYREQLTKATLEAMLKRNVINVNDKSFEGMKALLEVRREYIEAAIEEMKNSYGSVDSYLEKGLGLTAEKRAKLKKLYLK